MKWQPTIVVSTAPYDGYPLEVAFESIAAIDDVQVELAYIDGYVEAFTEGLFSEENAGTVARMLEAVGLRCHAVSAHTDLSGAAGLDRGLRRIRFAGGVHASAVVSNAARFEQRDAFLENLEPFAREAERCGVNLLLENPGDGKRNVVNDGPTGARVLDGLVGAPIGINYDFGNVISHFQNAVRPEEDYQSVRNTMAYVHLKDVIAEETVWRYPQLGTGMIDYRRILDEIASDARLEALGVELPLRLRRSAETPNGRTPHPLPLEEISQIVRNSVEYVRRCTRG